MNVDSTGHQTSVIEWSALLYLSAPVVLYALGFLQPVIGVGLAILLLVSIALLCPLRVGQSKILWITLASSLIAALLLLAIIGFRQSTYASDWIKHWALLRLLVEESWPVHVPISTIGEQWFRFYFGAYLLPAGLTKSVGLPIVVSTAMWYGLGFAMVFGLVQRERASGNSNRRWAVPFILLLLGGADGPALQFVRWLQGTPAPAWYAAHSEPWSNFLRGAPLQYSSSLTLFTWVPHQAIAAALATLLVVDRENGTPTAHSLAVDCLAMGALTLHSPYAAIGLAPFVALRAISILRDPTRPLAPPDVLIPLLTGIAIAVVVFLNLRVELPAGATLCAACVGGTSAVKILLFLAVELLPLCMCLRRHDFSDRQVQSALAILLVLPLLGSTLVDPVMRVSIPALVVLMSRVARRLAAIHVDEVSSFFRFSRTVIAVALMAASSIGELGYHVTTGAAHRALPKTDELRKDAYTDFARSPNVGLVEFFNRSGWNYRSQYFSRSRPPLYRDK